MFKFQKDPFPELKTPEDCAIIIGKFRWRLKINDVNNEIKQKVKKWNPIYVVEVWKYS